MTIDMTRNDYRLQLQYAIEIQSMMRLDHLGIHAPVYNLPSYKRKSWRNALLYGYNGITRFYCRYIFPRLFPDHVELIKSEIELCNTAIADEWKREVLIQGCEIMASLPE